MSHKPTLIIGCSDAKSSVACRAIDLYKGAMFQLLKANVPNDPLEHFNILILSAQHGLLRATEVIEPYNTRMVSRKNEKGILVFAETHRKNALRLLRQSPNGELYVLLSNDYLSAFDAMLGNKASSILRRFNGCYVSRKHQGIGELRGRLSRVIKHVLSKNTIGDETYFRSGIANQNELAFVAAGCAVGSSLAHCNANKSAHLLASLLESTRHGKLFLDNGLVTMINKGLPYNHDQIFDQYESIIDSLTAKQAKNLTIVIPDDVNCNQTARSIIERNKQKILRLARKVDVIVPIHRSPDMKQHIIDMLKPLNFSPRVRIGIPCLEKKGLDLALDLTQIDTILSTKVPTGCRKGESLIHRVHFFGMSDSTAPLKLKSRLMLTHMHGLKGEAISLDACRVSALFGYTKTGLRKGSIEAKSIEKRHIQAQQPYKEHTYKAEYCCPTSHGFVTQYLYDLITPDTMTLFWDTYNQALSKYPMFQVKNDFVNLDESMEIAWQMTSQRTIDQLLFDALKDSNWEEFKYSADINALDTKEARFQAIKSLFQTEHSIPLQLQIPFAA
ncbi:hypothetical protein VA249_45460 (plasmid) [Vibrio alfacsensis]|uniref:DUF6884 domain-containing protein n=1 Tax=Vibrio alfacsensis TaxID=1074311 RepID=UPI001BF00B69|nr:DUF6884 domain-containing protein [Vibrio alfacsensis]BBM67900.1 hypothetical protein VA249_45460 [Vibrio alfacsensis]